MTSPAGTFADHRRADEVGEARALACQARGCPLPWSIDHGSSRLCTAHAAAMPREWPAITERLLWLESERARENAAAPAPPARGPLAAALVPPTPEQLAQLQALRQRIADRSELALVTARWLELRSRERAGERLTRAQAEAWRAGLKMDASASAWAPAGFERAQADGYDW